MTTQAIAPTLKNFRQPLLALSPFCNDKICLLSHKLPQLDKQNFGKYYVANTEAPTNLYIRVCNNCLLAKYGLYESDNNDNTSFLNCIIKKTQNDEDKQIRVEGPYLKAYKTIPHVVNDEDKVFEKYTIILPAGNILMDIIMADKEHLFNVDSTLPKVLLTLSPGPLTVMYKLNPYIYGYFNHIHNIQTAPSTKQDLNLDKIKSFEDLLYQKSESENDKFCLAGIYEHEAFAMSNLIRSLAAESHYVKTGKNLILSPNKTLRVTLSGNRDNDNDAELALTSKHINVETTIANANGKLSLGIEKVNGLNQIIQLGGLSVRQLISNRKEGLRNYFKKQDKFYSADALHTLSFCVPSKITDSNNEIYRELMPNVTFLEGVGLVSTSDICKNELLIADIEVSLKDFIRLKMSSYNEGLRYSKLHVDNNVLPSSYTFEGRNREEDKSCLYSNF